MIVWLHTHTQTYKRDQMRNPLRIGAHENNVGTIQDMYTAVLYNKHVTVLQLHVCTCF